jgi:hypothetical protein
MSEPAPPNGVVREVVREVLEELLPRLAAPVAADGPVPQVPAPPVAAVHRPSSWQAADADPAPRGQGGATVEEVSIESDAELDAFVRRLLRLAENPRDRQALRAGRFRFALRPRAAGAAPGAAAVMRIERRAVTERVVDEAAAAGARLVLGPGAVLTPLARDRAKKLHVEIEKEKRC